jgi:dihydroorotate dehydrogenase (fumarate)
MKIGTVDIEPAVMNAACSVAKTLDDVKALAKTSIGGITVGSITLQNRNGNPEPRWYTAKNYALNSFGMPNEGADFYRIHLPEMIEVAHSAGKKLSLSIAGFSTAEYVELAQLANTANVDLLELNLGCPNVSMGGKQKPIASFDPTTINEIVDAVSDITNIPLLLKLSPYSNPAELQVVAQTISESGKVSAVVTSNTFANSTAFEEEAPVLAAQLGGLSGPALLPISLGQVWQFRKALPDHIVVIGVGGIESRLDAEQYRQAGAGGVQAATLIVRDGHDAIERLF